MDIKNKFAFLEALKKIQTNEDIRLNHYEQLSLNNAHLTKFVKIMDEKFVHTDFSDLRLTGFDFVNCIFDHCSFSDAIIWSCLFKDCIISNTKLSMSKFFESEFVSTKIKNCSCDLLHFADCTFKSVDYIDCYEMLDVYWGNCIFEAVNLQNSNITYSRLEHCFHQQKPQIIFTNCLLTRNYFSSLDLTEIMFGKGCNLNLNVFQNCLISETTFDESNNCSGQEYNSIDFASINKSSKIKEVQLINLFGILHSDIKEYVFGLTNEVRFQSVFISYSFKDKEFAKKMNSAILAKGIMTFMWEKDAPGGKGLNKIMRENIEKFDRILFISSEESLRSEACQFELSEGRKKQNKLWKEIYFPIHIDNYLFEVQKDDIRPMNKQEEYWDNIQELRKLNSIDFSEFVTTYNEDDFSKKIYLLVRDLKK